jgi:putative FmdB family regulatory protein
MPTYDYRCESCKENFIAIHGMKEKALGCPLCSSIEVKKTISLFAAKTENTLEHQMRHLEQQAFKDTVRLIKDDSFAANLSGADDTNHEAKKQKAMQEMHEKNERARQAIKRAET